MTRSGSDLRVRIRILKNKKGIILNCKVFFLNIRPPSRPHFLLLLVLLLLLLVLVNDSQTLCPMCQGRADRPSSAGSNFTSISLSGPPCVCPVICPICQAALRIQHSLLVTMDGGRQDGPGKSAEEGSWNGIWACS